MIFPRGEAKLSTPDQGVNNMPEQVWAGPGGSAILYTSRLASALQPSPEAQLHFVTAEVSKRLITLSDGGEAMTLDFQSAARKGSIKNRNKRLSLIASAT